MNEDRKRRSVKSYKLLTTLAFVLLIGNTESFAETTTLSTVNTSSEQQQAQQSQSTDWTSGVDVIEIGADILDFLGDVLSNIDINF
jgi:hypothetical protein